MKSTLLILLTMLLQIIFCNNLFLNGGFEEGKENKADAWSSGVWAGSDSIHYRSDKDAVNGKFCYYLEKRDSKGGLQLYSDKEINLPLPEYKESIIEISGAYKGNKTSITLQFRFYRVENGKMITLINSLKQYDCFNVKMNPSSGWKRFSQIISVPEQAKSHSSIIMRPYILLSQADSLFIDDLSLTARLKADSAVSQSTDDKYNLLENSGFEEGSGDKADDWSSGPWGGAKTVYKRSSTEKASGNFSYFLEKLDNQGGIQLFYNKYITLAGIDKNKYKVIVSGKYLGNKKTVYFQARLYKKEGDKIISLIDEKQKQISCKADLTPAGQWQAFSRELVLPAVTAGTGDIFLKPYIIFFNADSIYLDELAIHITRNGEPVLRISRQEIPADPLNGNFSRWKVAPIEPLSENEKKSYSPISLPNISFTVKDGNILKNGKPYFLIGTPTAGGGQWNSQTIWYPRVFKYDFVEKYDSVSRAMKVAVDENKNLNIAWNNAAWSFSHIRELYRNNIFVWMDIGTSDYKYLTQLTSHQDEFPEMKMLMQQRYGHFYPFDHANSFGRQLYQGAWSSYLRYYGNVQFLSLEIFNELGYSCSSPLTQNAFRNYLLQKYKSLPEINKVFTTSFRDKNDIIAPHLRENFSEYYQYKLNLEKSRAENFSLYNEWLEFLKIFLVENMRPLKKSVAAISKNNISIDARHELHEFDQYCTSDPELISEISDIYDFHLGPPLFFNYNNRPAQASDVLQSVICAGFYLDYIRSIIDKPIVNPECIISGTKPPQANEKFIIDNSLVNLHSKWKFSTDPGKKGMEQEWFKPGYNDASWDELEVPGMWEDLDSKYKTYDGWAWYRIKFVMPKKYQLAMEDGSVRYLIAGKGIDDNGKLFLNGNEILSLEGNNWQTEYTANINTYLKFGEENQLTVFINDSSLGGGIRFYITLIGDDMLAQKTPLEKPQMSALLWTYAVHGMSGIDIWHWDDDMVKTWLPEIKNSIDNVSEILLPRPRIKGKIAFFYSFETFRGLVNKFPEASDIMDYYGAMLFQQIPFDMLSGRKFLSSQNINSYPLIVIPYAELLRAGSFEKLKNYIADGGTAVLTYNSCEKEDYSYSKLPLDEFLGMERTGDASSNDQVLYKSQSFSLSPGGWSKKSGVYLKNKSAEVLAKYASGSPALLYKKNSKGSVYYIAAELDFTAVHTILRDILTREKISSPVIVHSENTSEFPYIEAQIIGNENKFLLYLVNWGGTEHVCLVKITGELIKNKNRIYNIRNIQENTGDRKTLTAQNLLDGIKIKLDVQMPKVLLFEAAESEQTVFMDLSSDRKKILEKIETMKNQPVPSGKPKALFLKRIPQMPLIGKLASPVLTQILEQADYEVCDIDYEDTVKNGISSYHMLVMAEDESLPYKNMKKDVREKFFLLIREYIENGGNLLLLGSAHVHYNACNLLINSIGKSFKLSTKPGFCRDEISCGFGDPVQIKIKNFTEHPLTSYIQELQFFACTALSMGGSSCTAIGSTSPKDTYFPDQPVIAAGQIGKGKVFIATDNSWVQPFRIEYADNAQFLFNIIHWFKGKPAEKYDKKAVIASLFITEQLMEKIETEEK